LEAAERVAVQPPQAPHRITSKSDDLGRAAVGWNGGLGGLAAGLHVPHWHDRTTRHNGRSAESPAAPKHASTTDTEKEPRRGTTGRRYGRA